MEDLQTKTVLLLPLEIVFRSELEAMKEYFTDKINDYLNLRMVDISDAEIERLLDGIAESYAIDDQWGK